MAEAQRLAKELVRCRTTFRAIVALHRGDFTAPSLVYMGPLHADRVQSVADWAQNALADIENAFDGTNGSKIEGHKK